MHLFHKWIVKEKEILLSGFEQLGKITGNVEGLKGSGSFFKKPCIVTYRCKWCGVEKVVRI